MYKCILTLALLSLIQLCSAQETVVYKDQKNTVSTVAKPGISFANAIANTSQLQLPSEINSSLKPFAPAKASNGSGTLFVAVLSNYELGVTTVTYKKENISTKLSGFAYHLALGFDLHYGIISDKRITSFSLGLAWVHFAAGGKYTDTSGMSHDAKFKVGYVGLPLTYTGILGADRTVGFYYQLGICPQYQVSAKNGDNSFDGLRKLITIPSFSIGLAIPQEAGKGGLNKIRLIGPYVSTTMSNISNNSAINFTCLTFGIRYYSMMLE